MYHDLFATVSKYLGFLPGSGSHRKQYQRTQRELCISKDPNQQLSGESGIFFSASFCLQHSQLVQTYLFAREIPECYITDYTFRDFSFTSKVGQNKQSECAQTTSRVYFQKGTGTYYLQNWKDETVMIFSSLQNFHKYAPTITNKKMGFLRFFQV